jgi:tRNA pseudouridine13 synthase
MLLKYHPKDFQVTEIPTIIPTKTENKFKIYLLTKNNISQLEVLNILYKKYKILSQEIGISGIKDKMAITKQYITLPKTYNPKIIKEKFTLEFLGYSKSQLKTGDLKGNSFLITIRDLEQEIPDKKFYTNYFDNQRFGTYSPEMKFVGKYVLQADFKKAVLAFLLSQTSPHPQLHENRKKLQENFENFGNLNYNLIYLDILEKEYNKNKSFKETYLKIPFKLKDLALSSYQSYLWNECIKEIIYKSKIKFKETKYKVGKLYIPKIKIEEKTFPQIGKNFDNLTINELEIITKILSKEKITKKQIKEVSYTGNFLKTQNRQTSIDIENYKNISIESDKLHKNKIVQTIKFDLPKGAYATMFIKQI